MGRVMEIFVTINALGGILAFIGVRAGVRRVLRRKKAAEEESTDVSVPN